MKIELQPGLLPRMPSSPQLLRPPWRWWRHRLLPCPDGNLYHQSYDPPPDPNVRFGGVDRVSIHFDLLHDYDITNPPSLFITELAPEFGRFYGRDYERSFMDRSGPTECDVVWYERPGERWQELPGNSCRPGDYQIGSRSRYEMNDNPSQRQEWSSDMAMLDWRATILPARASAVALAQELLEDERIFRFSLSALTMQIAAQAAIPPASIERPESRAMLSQILDARREFQLNNRRQPVAILMNRQDWIQLRNDAARDEDDFARRALLMDTAQYDRAMQQGGQLDTIFGLEIRAEDSVPRGRIMVIGEDATALAWPTLTFDCRPISDQIEAYRGTISNPLPTRRDVLPEEELIDEIDRLVNESVAVGPVDDYNADRYPRCPHCPHSWHGILCNQCDCLGELEEDV